MKRKLCKRKYIITFFIGSCIVISCYMLCINEFLIRTDFKGEYKSEKLDDKNIDNTSWHNFAIYIDRENKIKQSSEINYHFAIDTSNQIGGFRELPDTRHEACKWKTYDIPDDTTVAVIITYYNEARSTLLRTIISVLQRTPAQYLKEIIIVDDFNKDVTQGIDLQFLPLIRLTRNTKRLGVIESRNVGAKLATSEYILFLDSHCEVNNGWLEPLLSRLNIYPGVGVSPVLDIINSNTFQYKQSGSFLKGGFDWKLNFNWIPMTKEEKEYRIYHDDYVHPFVSPVFSGGIFMISKKWFFTLQGFNSLLKIWGGESIEMAIKVWLCGGQIEIVPCSRIGHVFVQGHSFDFPSGENTDTYLSNLKVIAESWLDEYKNFFYSMKPRAIDLQVPDLNGILKLKNQLKCRKFSWFLQIVFPDLKIPNEEYIAFGTLTSGNKCLSIKRITMKNTIKVQIINKLTMKDCQDTAVTNWYLHSTTGKLSTKSGTECLTVIKKTKTVVAEKCINNNNGNNNNGKGSRNENKSKNIYSKRNKNKRKNIFSSISSLSIVESSTDPQRWIRFGENLIHRDSQLCLDNFFKDMITVSLCRLSNPSQLFSFSVELQKL